MTIPRIIKSKIAARGMNQSSLAERSGFKSQTNVAMFLRSGANIKVSNLMAMLEALDCELVVKDNVTGESITISRTD